MDDAESVRREVALGMAMVARQMKRRFDLSGESAGVTNAKWTLIAVVSRFPGATQRTIAEVLNVTEASAGRLIDRLCTDGYLRRSANPQDRRAYRVFLTDAADPLMKELEAQAARLEAEAFAGVSLQELRRMKGVLDRIAANIAEAAPQAAEQPALEPEQA